MIYYNEVLKNEGINIKYILIKVIINVFISYLISFLFVTLPNWWKVFSPQVYTVPLLKRSLVN